jgi:hypothetical protein
MSSSEFDNKERIDILLKEYDDHRDALKSMIVDLEAIRIKIDTLIPTSLDARYMRFFEEKVKSITALFNALLEMRKEITKSVKDEIEIRRKIRDDDELIDIEDMVDVRKMVTKIEDFQKSAKKFQEKRMKENAEQTIDETIDIPGITSRVEGH